MNSYDNLKHKMVTTVKYSTVEQYSFREKGKSTVTWDQIEQNSSSEAAVLAAAGAVKQTGWPVVHDSNLPDSPFGTVVVAAKALEAACSAEATACLAALADQDQDPYQDTLEVDTLVAVVASALQKDPLDSAEGAADGETGLPQTDPYL
jgi:hypothetical protein